MSDTDPAAVPTREIPRVSTQKTRIFRIRSFIGFQRICNFLSIFSFIGFIGLWVSTRHALQSLSDQFAKAFDAANGKAGAPSFDVEFNPLATLFGGLWDGFCAIVDAMFNKGGIIIVLLIIIIVLGYSLKRTSRRNTSTTPSA